MHARPDEPERFTAIGESLVAADIATRRVTPARPDAEVAAAAHERRSAGFVVVLVFLAIVGVILDAVAGGYEVAEPGDVYAADLLAGTAAGPSTLLATSVRHRDVTVVDLVRAWVTGQGVERSADRSSVRTRPSGDGGFALAQRTAWAAAQRCAGLHPTAPPAPPDLDVSGPSAGLMMAIADVRALRGRPGAARLVAGTGMIDAGGRVHPVGAVAVKIRAAAREGAIVFLVPKQQQGDVAQGAAPRVVGVASLDEALRALGEPGCVA